MTSTAPRRRTPPTAAGQDAHDFHFPRLNAAKVRRVLAAAPDNPDGSYVAEHGGQCLAPGSPSA